jgi:hypothetical protein
MINGTYQIVMETLMGKRYGELTLHENERFLSGDINILGHDNEIKAGVIIDGICRFAGELVTPIRNIIFLAEGSVNETEVNLKIFTEKNVMSISGKKYKIK